MRATRCLEECPLLRTGKLLFAICSNTSDNEICYVNRSAGPECRFSTDGIAELLAARLELLKALLPMPFLFPPGKPWTLVQRMNLPVFLDHTLLDLLLFPHLKRR